MLHCCKSGRAPWQDELVLIVPRDHPLADVGQVTRDGLYSLTFVSVNAGSPVQSAQETTLHKHGILWRRLKVDMVGAGQGLTTSSFHMRRAPHAFAGLSAWKMAVTLNSNHQNTLDAACQAGKNPQSQPALLHCGSATPSRGLHRAQEFNSIEAIKGAVQAGLGVAFVSVLAIEKELSLGLVARVRIEGVTLPRTLWLINDPLRSLSQVRAAMMPVHRQNMHMPYAIDVFVIAPELWVHVPTLTTRRITNRVIACARSIL